MGERAILLGFIREPEGIFTAHRVQMLTRVEYVTVGTIMHIRRKRMVSLEDVKERLHFTREVLQYYDESLWLDKVCFYFNRKESSE